MRLGLGHGLDVGYRSELFGATSYLLDTYTGAAAAYSLRQLRTGVTSVVRVRRSSDNAEADFTAAEVSDGTMLSWVNTEVVKYTSDFSATEDWIEFNGTGAANIDGIAGVDDTYRFTLSGGSAVHLCIRNINAGYTYRVRFDYYIPSTNTALNSIQARDWGSVITPISGSTNATTVDSWDSLEFTYAALGAGNRLDFCAFDGTSIYFSADGDVFYLKNIVVTQLTADGHVVTWYDQSGNGKNFTQATAARQPKLVNAGSLITLNSFPAVEADGTDDFIQTAAGVFGTVTDLYSFTVGAFTETAQANDTFWGVSDGAYGGANNWFILRQLSGNNNFSETHGSGTEEATNGTTTTAQKLFTGIFDGGVGITLGVNGSDATETATIGASVSPTQELDLFAVDNSGTPASHGAVKAQELIFYAADKSADRAAIEAAINSHYSIY